MKKLLAGLLVLASSVTYAAPQVVPNCSWDNPGTNRFTGNLVAAVDNYKDIGPVTRDKLKKRIASATDYDDIVEIDHNSVKGKSAYYSSSITDMHFGSNSVCKTVSRSKWTIDHKERALVFCEDGVCLIVPTVCGNLARIEKRQGVARVAIAPVEPMDGGGGGPLLFAPLPPLAALPVPEEPSTIRTSAVPSFADSCGCMNQPITGGALWSGPSIYFPPIWLPPKATPPIPEPSTWMLLLIGGLVIMRLSRRKL